MIFFFQKQVYCKIKSNNDGAIITRHAFFFKIDKLQSFIVYY